MWYRIRRARGLGTFVVGNNAANGGENFLHRRFLRLGRLSHYASPLRIPTTRIQVRAFDTSFRDFTTRFLIELPDRSDATTEETIEGESFPQAQAEHRKYVRSKFERKDLSRAHCNMTLLGVMLQC